MKTRCLILLGAVQAAALANPVLSAADPHAEVIGGKVWLYPTKARDGRNFFAFESSDLKSWQEHGPILDFCDIPWIREDGRRRHNPWAPCIAEREGSFYFYYSVGPQSEEHPARIGVAVAKSPAGPFKDSGKPLLTGGNGFEAIDPMVFCDPADGTYYFYVGGSAGATLRVFELNEDMISFRRELPVTTPPHFTEGAFMHFHRNRYHLTYSHGGWRDATYSVHYATADSPMGPWKYRGELLKSGERHKGPGHHSIIRYPKDENAWFIVYHRWNDREGDGPYSGSRVVAIDRINYDADGFLQAVEMTDEGVTLASQEGDD